MSILFIQTGGTIDKDYPSGAHAYGFEILDASVSQILKTAKFNLEYACISVCKKDSQDLTDQDRANIKSAIISSKQNQVIITHGTDTMIETAIYLGQINHKRIIITGSYRPAAMNESDASFQLGASIMAVQLNPPGTYVCMNGQCISYENILRDPNYLNFSTRQ